MLVKYVFVYLMVDVFCLAFSLLILSKTAIDMGTEREVRAMRAFIIVYDVFLVADAVWAMGTYDTWLMSPEAAGIVEAATLLIMGFVAFCWFLYVEYRLGAPYANRRGFVVVSGIPIAIVVVLYATTRFTGLVYSVGADVSFEEGPLAIVPMVAFLLYVIFATLHALVEFFRSKSSVRRVMCLTLALFAIPPVACGILDIFMHGMPVMALSTFASILLVFMNTQDSRINTDALTGLNNRRRAMEYIEGALPAATEAAPLAVFMIDVDFFKEINDTHGHAGGDRALTLIAEGLRHAMAGRRGLAARWGGDEFLVAVSVKPGEDLLAMEELMRREIDAVCRQGDEGLEVSVSMGYALATGDSTISELIASADKRLYEQKAAHHIAARG